MTVFANHASCTPEIAPAALLRGDRTGFVLASLCALHCALLPVAMAAVPAVGIQLTGTADIDQALVLFASVLGIGTLSYGYRWHRRLRAWLLLLPGLGLLWLGAFSGLHDVHDWMHAVVMAGGGVLMAAAHLCNLRLSHQRDAAVRSAPGKVLDAA